MAEPVAFRVSTRPLYDDGGRGGGVGLQPATRGALAEPRAARRARPDVEHAAARGAKDDGVSHPFPYLTPSVSYLAWG